MMKPPTTSPTTAAELIELIERLDVTPIQRRDMVSAIRRICAMTGSSPTALRLDVVDLRQRLNVIRPAAHGISKKTYTNLRSRFVTALEHALVIQSLGRGLARRDAAWGPLLDAIADDTRLSNGLACFANWCVAAGIAPDEVSDESVADFQDRLEHMTLHPKPRELVRRVPNCWNDARVHQKRDLGHARRMKRSLSMAGLVFVAALACAGGAFAGPFEDGLSAFDRGDYAAALQHWKHLAEQGDV